MSGHDDCAYWGLTWIECCRYHRRLAEHASRRASWHAAKARHLARISNWLTAISVGLVILALTLYVIVGASS